MPRLWPSASGVPSFYEVKKGTLWGLLRADRSPWLSVSYTAINYKHQSQPHRIQVQKDSLFGILDTSGTAFLEPIYSEILNDGHYYKLRKGQVWGMKDKEAKEIIPLCFDLIIDHSVLRRSLLQKDGKWTSLGWLQEQKSDLCNPKAQYDYIEHIDNCYIVSKGQKWGLVDSLGKEISNFDYDGLTRFFRHTQRMVLAKKGEQLGLLRVNSQMQVIEEVPILYDEIVIDERNFKIKLRKGKNWDYNFEGEPFLSFRYNQVFYYDYVGKEPRSVDMFLVQKGKYWGMVEGSGEEVLKPRFKRIFIINYNNFLVLDKKERWGVVSRKGKERIPIVYKDFDYDQDKRLIQMKHKDGTVVPFRIK